MYYITRKFAGKLGVSHSQVISYTLRYSWQETYFVYFSKITSTFRYRFYPSPPPSERHLLNKVGVTTQYTRYRNFTEKYFLPTALTRLTSAPASISFFATSNLPWNIIQTWVVFCLRSKESNLERGRACLGEGEVERGEEALKDQLVDGRTAGLPSKLIN